MFFYRRKEKLRRLRLAELEKEYIHYQDKYIYALKKVEEIRLHLYDMEEDSSLKHFLRDWKRLQFYRNNMHYAQKKMEECLEEMNELK